MYTCLCVYKLDLNTVVYNRQNSAVLASQVRSNGVSANQRRGKEEMEAVGRPARLALGKIHNRGHLPRLPRPARLPGPLVGRRKLGLPPTQRGPLLFLSLHIRPGPPLRVPRSHSSLLPLSPRAVQSAGRGRSGESQTELRSSLLPPLQSWNIRS